MRRMVGLLFLWIGLAGLTACAGGVPSPFADRPAARPGQTVATIRIAAPVGAPETHAAALLRQMEARAAERSIAIAGPDAGNGGYALKGYFSTITERNATTVLYVWDVLDSAANRVHRIQGQAPAPAGGNGWPDVPESVMHEIGTATIDQFADWVTRRS